jgi:Na+/alanine symporter
MGKIDEIKEEIGWLKVWLGILVVTMFGMIGWGISHIGKVSNLLLILDAVSIVMISIIVAIINFSAIKKIRSLKDL